MYSVSCKQLGADCDFVAKGQTPNQTRAKIFKHAIEEHDEEMKHMDEPDFEQEFNALD